MRKAPPGPVRLVIVIVVLASASQLFARSVEASPADDIEPALRDSWSRGLERFQREWLIAGPASEARRGDRWTVEGNVERRAGWELRRAPAPGYGVPPAALEANAGPYELFPGVPLTVTNQDGQLTLRVPGQPEVTLIPESETIFGHPLSGGAIEFVRDADGRVTGVELEGFGQTILARRLPIE